MFGIPTWLLCLFVVIGIVLFVVLSQMSVTVLPPGPVAGNVHLEFPAACRLTY